MITLMFVSRGTPFPTPMAPVWRIPCYFGLMWRFLPLRKKGIKDRSLNVEARLLQALEIKQSSLKGSGASSGP